MPDDSITLRIEDALERSVARACGPAAPSLPRPRDAPLPCFPAGARIRPRLALSVALCLRRRQADRRLGRGGCHRAPPLRLACSR